MLSVVHALGHLLVEMLEIDYAGADLN